MCEHSQVTRFGCCARPLYGARTGKRILALNVAPVLPAVQTFAIFPHEEQLAVLTTDQIACTVSHRFSIIK